MAVNPWFKFYGGEYLADPKVSSLSAQERSCWITLLALASTASTPGTVEFLTIETLLEKSGIHFDPYDTNEWDKCISVLDRFARMRMIEKGDDGIITILNWSKRQETNLTDAERAKSYRDRQKERHANVTGNVTTVTQEEKREEEIREDKSKSADAPALKAKSFFEGGDEYHSIRQSLSESIPEELLDTELEKFVAYWTEPNSTGKKVRWQNEKHFEVRRRLASWFSRIKSNARPVNRGRGLAN